MRPVDSGNDWGVAEDMGRFEWVDGGWSWMVFRNKVGVWENLGVAAYMEK